MSARSIRRPRAGPAVREDAGPPDARPRGEAEAGEASGDDARRAPLLVGELGVRVEVAARRRKPRELLRGNLGEELFDARGQGRHARDYRIAP